ncbi:MAG TPA: protease complex subunit PrcB family protein, partial [Pyrinomonadaceae bacterium]|nr:protease complex subunit PrcB family protein [Pyrinomonadaceae bacterium]
MIEQKFSVLVLALTLSAGSAGGCGVQGQGGGGGSAQQPKQTKPDKPTPTPRAEEMPMPTNSELKELAAGGYSSVHDSFVLVARDADTYAALRELVKDLPDEPPAFFKANAVVAAFLGQRRSGGYGVEIKQTGRGQLSINEHAPPKDAMVTMALTAPFRVVALPVSMDESLALTLDATWRARLRPYEITEGDVTVFG